MTDTPITPITPETVREAMACASVLPYAHICAMAPDLARAYLAAMEENARLKAGRRAIAAEAKLAAAMEGTVRVKPLEWSEYRVSNGTRQIAHAVTPLVTYRITQKFFPETLFSIEVVDGGFLSADTLEAAKAAAQADYERRILAALDPAQIVKDMSVADLPPTDEQIMAHPKVKALVEAAEAEAEKWKKAFAAQSNKLQSVLHIEGVRDALRDLKGGE